MAAALALAQLRAQMAQPLYASAPGLGLLYITDHYAAHAAELLQFLGAELPWVSDWAGAAALGIAASGAEYVDEPALAVMLLDLPSDQYRVFSGIAPLSLGFEARTALVHADGATPDLGELVQEMAERTDAGFLFGGLGSSRAGCLQFALAGDGTLKGHGSSDGVFDGGLSGVAFGPGVGMVSRITQGCKPVSVAHTVTAADHNVMVALDGEPALDVLMRDLHLSMDAPQATLDAIRATLVGLTAADGTPVHQTGNFGNDVRVRHIIGLDPVRRGVAVAERVGENARMAFCQRNMQAARADLMRICAEIREELEPQDMPLQPAHALSASPADPAVQEARQMLGAVYVSCTGRGGAHFGSPGAELQLISHALGDVPLVGFFAAGEIAYDRLYGYTGVLTVFTS